VSDRKYLLLLNESLKKHLAAFGDQEKRRVREKLEFLSNGIWDSGVRVKKLRGVSGKAVFEARLNRSDRLLFTLGRRGDTVVIYLWGLVRHDEIGSQARAIVPENAPFLLFESAEEEERPDLSLDRLAPELYTQEDIEERAPSDYGPQKWLVLDDAGWERLLRTSDPDGIEIHLFLTREQESLLAQAPPLLLSGTAGSGKTTLSVYYLLRAEVLERPRLFLTYSPYLLRFSRRIYEGLVRETALEGVAVHPDFLTFRELLLGLTRGGRRAFPPEKEVTLKEFSRIFANHKDARRFDPELVWEEIRSIIKGAKLPLSPRRFRDLCGACRDGRLTRAGASELKEFLAGFQRLAISRGARAFVEKRTSFPDLERFVAAFDPASPSDDALAVLEEILLMTEKRAADFRRPLLSLEEYRELGRKRAPNFLYEREALWSIASYCQERMEAAGLWDEIDLCREALDALGAPAEEARATPAETGWDLVVCDEAQDFCDVQLSLIFRLARRPGAVVLTGDPRQVINPSGFRWEEAKNAFYERGLPVPEIRSLSLNFRCVGHIVRLANALLDLKQKLVGLSGSELREQWKFNGTPPLLVHGVTPERMLAALRGAGAGRIVLTRDAARRDELKKALATELVFTVQDAKGLEFDAALLWECGADADSAALWRRVGAQRALEPEHAPRMRHELNLLYVAVTRARNTLVVFDGEEAADVWRMDGLREILFPTRETERLAELWRAASSPAEWERQGDYFLEREHYPAAMECFRHAGAAEKEERAKAFVREAEGAWAEAALLFARHGMAERAAGCYEKAEDFRSALPLWRVLGRGERAALCAVRLLEQDGDWNGAAAAWASMGETERAVRAWERAGNWLKLAEHHGGLKAWDRAAAFFEKAGRNVEAAGCHRRAGRLQKAAEILMRSGHWAEAAPVWKKLGNTEQLALCYRNLKDHHALGALLEKKGEHARAIAAFRQFASASPENRLKLERDIRSSRTGRLTLRSAIRQAALGRHDLAGPVFLDAGLADLAAREFKEAGDRAGMAECMALSGRLREAAAEVEDSGLEARRKEELSERYLRLFLARNPGQARPSVQDDADRLRAEGRWEKALTRFRALDDADGVFEAHLHLDREEEAMRELALGGAIAQARRLLERKAPAVTPAFVTEMTDRLLGSAEEAREDMRLRLDFLSMLCRRILGRPPSQEAQAAVQRFFELVPSLLFRDDVPDSVLDLALDAGGIRVIYNYLTLAANHARPAEGAGGGLLEKVRRKAEAGDAALAACLAIATGRGDFEEAVASVPLTPMSVDMISESVTRFREAVAWFEAREDWDGALEALRFHRDLLGAGRLLERLGDSGEAARCYRDGGLWDEMLRCARACGDLRAEARALEGRGDFAESLAAWKRAGNAQAVKRVAAKLEKRARPELSP